MALGNISRRTFLRAVATAAVATPVSGVGGYVYSTNIEPTNLDINHVTLTLPRLDPQFDGFRLAQLSDFHMGSWMTGKRLTDIIRIVNDEAPDMVALTGDYFTGTSPDQRGRHNDEESFNSTRTNIFAEDVEMACSLIQAPTIGVLGNHDHRGWPALVREIFARTGVIDLSNTVYTLERDGAFLQFGGVDDIKMGRDRLDVVLDQLPSDGAAILLAHEPDFADATVRTGRFDLQISGHSHGGQVILPFVGPLVLPELGQKYPIGLYELDGMYQYTNRGIGMSEPAVRFNCRPELTIFTFESPHASKSAI